MTGGDHALGKTATPVCGRLVAAAATRELEAFTLERKREAPLTLDWYCLRGAAPGAVLGGHRHWRVLASNLILQRRRLMFSNDERRPTPNVNA